jgi:hypothetical protein
MTTMPFRFHIISLFVCVTGFHAFRIGEVVASYNAVNTSSQNTALAMYAHTAWITAGPQNMSVLRKASQRLEMLPTVVDFVSVVRCALPAR